MIPAAIKAIPVALKKLSGAVKYINKAIYAVSNFINVSSGLSRALDGIRGDNDRTGGSFEDLRERIKDSEKAFKETTTQADRSAGRLNYLIDTVCRLAGQSDRTAVEVDILERYIDDLNSMLPDAGLAFDNYTGAINRSKEAMQNLTKLQRTELDLVANHENLSTHRNKRPIDFALAA